jgi:hypothetical protein
LTPHSLDTPAGIRLDAYIVLMPYVTRAELVEIVPDLRAMAIVKASTEVQAALNRLADRYAAMATKCEPPERVTLAREFAG